MTLDAIRKLLLPQATVVPGGCPCSIVGEELVPGDVMLLQSGDQDHDEK